MEYRRVASLALLAGTVAFLAAGPRSKRWEDVLPVVYRQAGVPERRVADLPPGIRDTVVCAALAVLWEAGGESEPGRLAVAKVVHRRMQERGQTGCGVVFAQSQFEWTTRPVVRQVPRDGQQWARSLREAYRVVVLGEGNAGWTHNHFYAFKLVKPIWALRCVRSETFGLHRFCTISARRWR